MENEKPIEITINGANQYSGRSLNHRVVNTSIMINLDLKNKIVNNYINKRLTIDDLNDIIKKRE